MNEHENFWRGEVYKSYIQVQRADTSFHMYNDSVYKSSIQVLIRHSICTMIDTEIYIAICFPNKTKSTIVVSTKMLIKLL